MLPKRPVKVLSSSISPLRPTSAPSVNPKMCSVSIDGFSFSVKPLPSQRNALKNGLIARYGDLQLGSLKAHHLLEAPVAKLVDLVEASRRRTDSSPILAM